MKIINAENGNVAVQIIVTGLALIGCAVVSANPLVLDWDELTWLPAGNSNLIQTYSVGNHDVVVEVGGNTGGLDQTGPTISPELNSVNTGGLVPAEDSLSIGTDYIDNIDNEVVITFDFSDFEGGVSGITFSIFDVDESLSFIDEVTITAVANSVLVNPTSLNTSPNNIATSDNTVIGALGFGAPANSPDGNVDIVFSQFGITELTIVYRNVVDSSVVIDPGFQWISIHDISFNATPVPIPGALVLFISALGGFLVRVRISENTKA